MWATPTRWPPDLTNQRLGLRLSGKIIGQATFMNAGPGDHHIFGFIQSTHTGLHHTSREVASIDEIAMGAQTMQQCGHHDIGHITERWQGRTWDIPPRVRRSAMSKHFTHNFASPSDALTTAQPDRAAARGPVSVPDWSTPVKIGLGLPICDSRTLMTWARRIDLGPFSSIGFLDRLVYHNPETLITLAGAAAVTNRARILTEVLIAPLRNSAVLAKQCATLDQLSGGRLTLGLGAGPRADDFAAAGVPMSRRGRILDEQLTTLRRLWAGEPFSAEAGPIGPPPVQPGGPEILVGGYVRAAFERVARQADGFLCAAAPADTGALFRSVEHFWAAAGRAGSPRLVAQLNVALGTPEQIDSSRAAMQRYYAFLPDPAAHAAEMLSSTDAIREAILIFSDIGADEVMLYCWSDRVDQIARFADLAA